jgi:hypothetical protein
MNKLRQLLDRISVAIILLVVPTVYLPENQAEPPYRIFLPAVQISTDGSSLEIAEVSDNRADYPSSQIPKFDKFEISFQVLNTVAGNFQLPFDPNPPVGIDLSNPKHSGITVDALFLPPGETDWGKAIRQPAFYYQYFDDQIKLGW